MPTGRHLSPGAKMVASAGALIAIAIGVMAALGMFERATTAYTFPAPTDVAQIGTLTFDTPGLKQDTPYLVYEEPGKPALTAELILDENSYCSPGSGGVPCVAMSAQYSQVFGGKRALVEGIREGDAIRVRAIHVLQEGMPELPRDPGVVYIPWPQATTIIKNCDAAMVMQTHAGDVTIRLYDDREVVAVEPVIDEVFKIVQDATATCGDIPVATE